MALASLGGPVSKRKYKDMTWNPRGTVDENMNKHKRRDYDLPDASLWAKPESYHAVKPKEGKRVVRREPVFRYLGRKLFGKE